VLADELSGPDRRCPGATDDELVGLLSRWAALESWVAAAKLGVLRELIRRRARPGLAGNRHGDLPDAWEESTLVSMSDPVRDLPVSSPAVEEAVELARAGVITHLTIRGERVAAIVPESVIEALRAAEDAEDAAYADAAMAEPGESVAWDHLKTELGL
jgi:hypothetical protein